MAKEIRSSRWATIIYPESAPADFLDKMKDLKVSFLLSPLHNSDINKDGTVKKAHYHAMFYFDSLKSRNQVSFMFEQFCGVGAECVQSATNYARYLCHLDDPDKAQYDPTNVIAYGLDYAECSKNSDYKYEGIGGIIDYVLDNNVSSFASLLISLRKEKSPLFKAVCDNPYLVRSLISSLKQDFTETKSGDVIDESTGEIVSRETL